MNVNDTSRLINETGVVPKKSKGQNFLTDERVAQRHIDYACSLRASMRLLTNTR